MRRLLRRVKKNGVVKEGGVLIKYEKDRDIFIIQPFLKFGKVSQDLLELIVDLIYYHKYTEIVEKTDGYIGFRYSSTL